MNIWILVLGEPLENEKGNPRMHRAGMLARHLVKGGHSVVFWTSNVDHFKKIARCNESREIQIKDNYKIIELAGRLYKKNISLSRILHNFEVTKEFKRLAKFEKKPDLLLANYPIIELTEAAIEYSNLNNIPSIVDIRDFWPDIFYEILPTRLKFIGDIIFMPWHLKAKNIVNKVTAITGISEEAIKWARAKNNQNIQKVDKSFTLAYKNEVQFNYDRNLLDKYNLNPKKHSIYCFFGSLNTRIELDTVMSASKILNTKKNLNIKLVICGSGEMLNLLKETAKTCPSLVLPGWIDKNQINTLLTVSKAGILPYPSTIDFTRSFPNKVGEYLSKHLPILSSVKGEMQKLLEDWNCGITYENNSPESLVMAINIIESNPESRMQMSANAGKCYRAMFDSDIVYENYVRYIESFVDG